MHDLWSQLENEQTQENSNGQNDAAAPTVESDLAVNPAITSRQRRPSERMIIAQLRAWLLHSYVPSYGRTLGSTRIYRRCYWFDALGVDKKQLQLPVPASSEQAVQPSKKTRANGRGTSKNKKASKAELEANVPPILQPLTVIANQLRQEAQPLKLQGIILESGSSRNKTPHTLNLPTLEADAQGEIVHASWLEAAPTLLSQIDQSPAIFLLNPFGPVLFSIEALNAITQRTAPTELVLLIEHKQLTTHLNAARRNTQQGQILTALLKSDRWKSLLPPPTGMGREPDLNGVIDLLIKSIQRGFLTVQSIDFRMQTSPTSAGHPPFTLLFATRRQDSLARMNDAVCLYQRQLIERGRQGVLGETWFAEREQQRLALERAQLCQRISSQGKAQRVRRWPDLRQYFLLNNFGQFTVAEYDSIILELWSEGAVKIQWRRIQTEESNPHAPGIEDTLIWR